MANYQSFLLKIKKNQPYVTQAIIVFLGLGALAFLCKAWGNMLAIPTKTSEINLLI